MRIHNAYGSFGLITINAIRKLRPGTATPNQTRGVLQHPPHTKKSGETLSCPARMGNSEQNLQRAQEVENVLSLAGREDDFKVVLHRGGFAAVALVGFDVAQQYGAAAVMLESYTLTQPTHRPQTEQLT